MSDKKCWFCGRTEKEVKEANFVEFEKNGLIKFESACYTNMPFVCNVCLELFSCHMVKEKVVFTDELERN